MFAHVKQFLIGLGKDHNCNLKVLKDDSTFWKDKLIVEFSGTKENLTLLQEEFVISITKYNLPASVTNAKYKIISYDLKESEHEREVILEVKSSKSSKIKELAEALAEELYLGSEISEESNGFLKGKTVTISALGIPII